MCVSAIAVKLKLSSLAYYASVSKDDKLNILGIFQDINAEAFPVTVPHMYAVLSCEAAPAEYGKELSVHVALLDEDNNGNEVLSLEGGAEVARPKHSADSVIVNIVVGLSLVHFGHAGNYRFSFSVDNEEIASIPLRANKLE